MIYSQKDKEETKIKSPSDEINSMAKQTSPSETETSPEEKNAYPDSEFSLMDSGEEVKEDDLKEDEESDDEEENNNSDYGDGGGTRKAEQDIFNIDDSKCMWNYVNSVSIQGRLYFNDHIKVNDTSLKVRVASFNILIKKETKNGVKKHRIYVKTYSKKVIDWLQQQKVGTWVRVEGRLESVSGTNYINASTITPFSDEHMKAMFADDPNRLMDWSSLDKKDSTQQSQTDTENLGQNNVEAQNKLKQIKNQTRTILSHAQTLTVEEDEDENGENYGQPAPAVATIDYELDTAEIAEICRKTNDTLIFHDDDNDGLEDALAEEDKDDDDDITEEEKPETSTEAEEEKDDDVAGFEDIPSREKDVPNFTTEANVPATADESKNDDKETEIIEDDFPTENTDVKLRYQENEPNSQRQTVDKPQEENRRLEPSPVAPKAPNTAKTTSDEETPQEKIRIVSAPSVNRNAPRVIPGFRLVKKTRHDNDEDDKRGYRTRFSHFDD